jgi:hypothetical protein
MFGFGKSKIEKEYEKDLESFNKIHSLLMMSSIVPFLTKNTERKKVIMAIFFEVIIAEMFTKYGEGVSDKVLGMLLQKISSDEFEGRNFESAHINIARKLVQLEKNKIAISVAESALTLFEYNENFGYSLNAVLMDESIKWDHISD